MIGPDEPQVCEHGGLAGVLRSGEPRCPHCRHEKRLADVRAERFRRLDPEGFFDGRMRAANDKTLFDD